MLKRAAVLCALAVLWACADSAVATEPDPEHGYGSDMFAFVAGADTTCMPRSCWALAVAMGGDTAYTDRTGRFAFERVPQGEHRLHVVGADHPRRTAPEAPSTYWHTVVFVDTARANVSGPNARIEVVLDAGTVPVVAGRFLRLSGGEARRPVPPGLAVALYASDGAPELDRGATDAHGEVVFRPLSVEDVGDHRLRGEARVLGSDPGDARYACDGESTRGRGYHWEILRCEEWHEAVRLPVLRALYEATDGANWRNSEGWMTDAPQEQWHGVGLDGAGRLTGLNLSGNGLRGRLPTRLAALDALNASRIGDNPAFGGRLPLSLARLELRVLHYAGTDLCAPATAAFRAWIAAIASHEGTGASIVTPRRPSATFCGRSTTRRTGRTGTAPKAG